MKKLFFTIAVISASFSAFAADKCENASIRFVDLPFSEGKLYLAVECDGKNIHISATDIEDGVLTIPLDLSNCRNKVIDIKAFQDLNDNQTLDFDSFGRPEEPCLQTKTSIDSATSCIELRLQQF